MAIRSLRDDLEDLERRLAALGYERNYLVERPGEFSVRGGILDVYPPGAVPVRADFFGDEITSLKTFSIGSQRSLGETVEEFDAGEVVPPEDIEALAAACVRLLGDDGRRDEAVRGAARAREALTWEAAAGQHEALYSELVQGGARPGESLP